MKENIKRLNEIISLCKEELENEDENTFATMDIHDIQALSELIDDYERLGEIDDKEASDALHMLLHCALTNKDFETQKQQFQIVNAYIKQLEEENKKLKKVKSDELIINNPWLFDYLNESYIFKGKIKEKIEELDKRIKSNVTEDEYKKNRIYTCKDFNEFITSVLQELLDS